MQRIRSAFEQPTPASLPALASIYADDAQFKDPFNEVQGTAAIRAVVEHMFATLQNPRFVIHDCIVRGQQCF